MTEKRLLSFRQAAKLLGVGRGDKLLRLIADGHLKTVSVYGEEKIPLSEIDRFSQTGTEPPPKRVPSLPRAQISKGEEMAAALMAQKF